MISILSISERYFHLRQYYLKIFFIKLTGMTGGVMSRGKSRMTRDRTSLPPESTRNTYYALPALTLPVPSVPYTSWGQRHQRTAVLEMRHDRLPCKSKHWLLWRLTSFEILILRLSPPSIVGERRTGRPAATTWPARHILWHIDPRTWYLVFSTFVMLNLG